MIVTFCGHSDIQSIHDVSGWLREVIPTLIEQGATVFYLGGYGAFDRTANRILREMKETNPSIENIMVLPYLNHKFDAKEYTGSVYPPLEKVPKKICIVKRNEWMVNEADVVVSYVVFGFGGAAKTLDYAKRKKKIIINYSD